MNRIRLGAAIVVYDGADFLVPCLAALYPYCDAIAICEGAWLERRNDLPPRSTDGTLEIIAHFPDPGRKLIRLEDNCEECHARQRCLEALRTAKCDWMLVADADEIYSSASMRRMLVELDADETYAFHDVENFTFYFDFLRGMREGCPALYRLTDDVWFGGDRELFMAEHWFGFNGKAVQGVRYHGIAPGEFSYFHSDGNHMRLLHNRPHETYWSDFGHLDPRENEDYLRGRSKVRRHGILACHYGYVGLAKVRERLRINESKYGGKERLDAWFELHRAWRPGDVCHHVMGPAELVRFRGEHPEVMRGHPYWGREWPDPIFFDPPPLGWGNPELRPLACDLRAWDETNDEPIARDALMRKVESLCVAGSRVGILDAGCGIGEDALYCVPLVRDGRAEYRGIDCSPARLRAARERCDLAFLECDVQSNDFYAAAGGWHEIVIARRLLEHVRFPDLALENLCAVAGRHLLIECARPLIDAPTVRCHDPERDRWQHTLGRRELAAVLERNRFALRSDDGTTIHAERT